MKCSLCDKTALYQVFFKGFCRDHYDQGVKAEAADRLKQKAWAIKNRNLGLAQTRDWGMMARTSNLRGKTDNAGSISDELRSLAVSDFKPSDKRNEYVPYKKGRPKKKGAK